MVPPPASPSHEVFLEPGEEHVRGDPPRPTGVEVRLRAQLLERRGGRGQAGCTEHDERGQELPGGGACDEKTGPAQGG